MRIAIGTDHRGFALKEAILAHYLSLVPQVEQLTQIPLGTAPAHWTDCGAYGAERSDYPVFAQAVCKKILRSEAELGILLCGSGGGIAIAANRFRGIYAVVALSEQFARAAREHDHCNVLVLPADYVTVAQAIACIDAWLAASPREGRYAERLKMIDDALFTQL
jgi:ribose 5-phosphate isomerase B